MKVNLDDLVKLERLRSLKSQKALNDILAEEAHLRDQLETLRTHRRDSNALNPELTAMRAIGSDVLWQAWIDRTQAELNMELARTLARKEPILQHAKRDIGRKDVAESAASDYMRQKKTDAAKKSVNNTIQQAVSLRALVPTKKI